MIEVLITFYHYNSFDATNDMKTTTQLTLVPRYYVIQRNLVSKCEHIQVTQLFFLLVLGECPVFLVSFYTKVCLGLCRR